MPAAPAKPTATEVTRARIAMMIGLAFGLGALIPVLISDLPGRYLTSVILAIIGAAIITIGGAPHDKDLRATIAKTMRPGQARKQHHTLRMLIAIVTLLQALPPSMFAILKGGDYIPGAVFVTALAILTTHFLRDIGTIQDARSE